MSKAYSTTFHDTTIVVTEQTLELIENRFGGYSENPGQSAEARALEALRTTFQESEIPEITTDAKGRRIITLDDVGYWDEAGFGFIDHLNALLLTAEPGAFREDRDVETCQDLDERTYVVVNHDGDKVLATITPQLIWPDPPSVDTLMTLTSA